jgi:hypothetical protein
MAAYTQYQILDPINGRMVTGLITVTTGLTSVDVYTGLGMVTGVQLTLKAASVATSLPVFNETLPLNGETPVTVVCTSGMVISYCMLGY